MSDASMPQCKDCGEVEYGCRCRCPDDRPSFVLELRPTPQCASPIRSLRWVLKNALRAHQLRAVSVREVSQVTT
jgi:hypothetical protein